MRRLGVHLIAAVAALSAVACTSKSNDATKASPAVTGVVISSQPAPKADPLPSTTPAVATDTPDDRTASKPRKRRAKKTDVAGPDLLSGGVAALPIAKSSAPAAAPPSTAAPPAAAPAPAAPPAAAPADSESLAQRAADVDQHPYDTPPKGVQKIDQHPYD